MKVFNRTRLPDQVRYNGKLYFKDMSLSSKLMQGENLSNLKGYIQVNVLNRRVRGVNDLHGRPYQPTKWLFKKRDNQVVNKLL